MPARLLFIEDDPDISFLYKQALEGVGYEVIIAESGEEGLQRAQEEVFTAILLDLMLPGVHGMTVLKELKKQTITQKTPVFVFTAIGDAIVAEQAYSFGAEAYFVKSTLDPGELADTMLSLTHQENL